MARKRQVEPGLPFEKEIRALSISARYFYVMSWCHMSDPNEKEKRVGGVMPYDEFFLKSNIFPDEGVAVQPLIDEIIAQQRYFPFEAQGKKWLWCPTLVKHQMISHPAKDGYPDPPKELQEQYRSAHGALQQSRVEGVERVEDDIKDQPSEKLKAALDKILEGGFNIYKLMGRLKKEMGWPPEQLFPEDVLLGVCASHESSKATIKDQWAWFKVVMRQESEKYYALKNIAEHQKLKEAGPMSLGELLRKIQKGEQ